MAKITMYRRVVKPVYEPVEIDEDEIVSQVEAARLAGREYVQDVSNAIRTGRVDGYVRAAADGQPIYILRSDVELLKPVKGRGAKGARKAARKR